MLIAVKERREGVLAADCHTLHKLFIGELTEVFGLQPKRLGETHFRSTSQISLGTQPRRIDSHLYNTSARLHSEIYFRSPWPISCPARAHFSLNPIGTFLCSEQESWPSVSTRQILCAKSGPLKFSAVW